MEIKYYLYVYEYEIHNMYTSLITEFPSLMYTTIEYICLPT